MGFPKLGMYYDDVRARLKRYKTVKTNPYLKESLKNQAVLHEGAGVRNELDEEFERGSQRSFSGMGNKQIGIGEGRREREAGTYIYIDGKGWVKEK